MLLKMSPVTINSNKLSSKIYNLHFRNYTVSQNSDSSQNLFTFRFSPPSSTPFSPGRMTFGGKGGQNHLGGFVALHQAKEFVCVYVCICFFFPWRFGMNAVLGIFSYYFILKEFPLQLNFIFQRLFWGSPDSLPVEKPCET